MSLTIQESLPTHFYTSVPTMSLSNVPPELIWIGAFDDADNCLRAVSACGQYHMFGVSKTECSVLRLTDAFALSGALFMHRVVDGKFITLPIGHDACQPLVDHIMLAI